MLPTPPSPYSCRVKEYLEHRDFPVLREQLVRKEQLARLD
jgi:hypothetical protein